MRVFGPGRNEDHITGAHRQRLLRHTQRAFTLQDDEHLFLRQVVVEGATPLAGCQFVVARAQFGSGGAG